MPQGRIIMSDDAKNKAEENVEDHVKLDEKEFRIDKGYDEGGFGSLSDPMNGLMSLFRVDTCKIQYGIEDNTYSLDLLDDFAQENLTMCRDNCDSEEDRRMIDTILDRAR